ncbi:ectonucleotide pyrophosphatase/phosphodiesterase family member 7-like [Apostichopus japonicus]
MADSTRTIFMLGLQLLALLFGVDGFIASKKQKVILVLVDGLRWDKYGLELSSLQRFEDRGVRADWLNGVFVTYTVPNLYSIATGLYPESHGVIHNIVFNSTTKTRTVHFEDVVNITEWFDTGAEPVWVTAKEAGKKVGGIMYPGTGVPIKGVLSDRIVHLSHWSLTNYPMTDRALDAVSWIADDEFDLVLLYMNLPDYTLHESKIGTERSNHDIMRANTALNTLLDDVDRRGLWDTLNVIVVSDHGHVNIDKDKYVSLTDYIDEDDIEFSVMYGSALFQLMPRPGRLNKVYRQLVKANPVMHVYKKEDFPERFHYGNHPRNLPIIGFLDPGWHVHMTFNPLTDTVLNGSDHGFDNSAMEMKASFYAKGPAFKSNFRARPLESVDIYQMMCDILKLEAVPNNGSRPRYTKMMTGPSDDLQDIHTTYNIVITMSLLFTFVSLLMHGWPTLGSSYYVMSSIDA